MDHDWGDKQVAVLKAATVQDFEAIIRTLKVDDRRGDHDAQRHEVRKQHADERIELYARQMLFQPRRRIGRLRLWPAPFVLGLLRSLPEEQITALLQPG